MSDKLTANEQAGLSNRFYATDPTRIQIEIFEKLLALSSLPSQQAPRKDGLLPCPFCGEVPKMTTWHLPSNSDSDEAYEERELRACVRCSSKNCQVAAYTLAYDSIDKAATFWNTRPSAAHHSPDDAVGKGDA